MVGDDTLVIYPSDILPGNPVTLGKIKSQNCKDNTEVKTLPIMNKLLMGKPN